MHFVAVRAVFSFLVPGGLLLTAAWVILHMGLLEESLPTLAHIYLYVVAVAGGMFGWRFSRSRLVFAIIVLVLADTALVHFVAGSSMHQGVGRTVFNAVAFLLPLNLVLFSMVKERGILTLRGIWRLSFVLLQPVALFLVWKYQRWDMASCLGFEFVHIPFLTAIPLAQPALLAFAAAFLLLTFQIFKRRATIECGFFWALISVLLAFVAGSVGPLSTVYFATAGLILVVSTVESSHSMAFRDELTGLPARRALDEALFKLGGSYTVAMADIDRFKQFNDTYGHDVGDQVLRMVGSKLAKVAGGGKPFRYGGEEFAVIFPGKLADESIPYLERVRKAVAESDFVLRSPDRPSSKPDRPRAMTGPRKTVSVTISIGAAERNERNTSPQQVIKAADKALYAAKKAGRNRVRA